MGDNNIRARAWPQREGQCGVCGRWIRLATARGVTPALINRHDCNGVMRTKSAAVDVYEPTVEA